MTNDYQGPLYAPHPALALNPQGDSIYKPQDKSFSTYVPRVNDYVKWDHLQGWIYHIDPTNQYLTLEIMVREKTEQSYKDCSIHRNERCLVCCYPENWHELEYVRSR